MELSNGESRNYLLEAQAHIWNHTFNFIKSMSLKCAVELHILDIIHSHGQPMTLSELISALQINPSKSHHINRLMRILVHSGFFSLQKLGDNRHENGYLLTKTSLLLLKDHPQSARPHVLAALDPILTEPSHFLSSWFQNDDHPTPFSIAHGETFWDFASHEAKFNSSFNEAMASDSSLVIEVLVNDSKCKEVFKGLNSLVDVGGSTGIMAKAISEKFPNMKCTVLDLPHVVAGLQNDKNLNFLAGNMFDYIPPADAVLLKVYIIPNSYSNRLQNCKVSSLLILFFATINRWYFT